MSTTWFSYMILLYDYTHIIIYTDDDNRIVLKPTDSFIGAAFINACYIDVSIVMYTDKNVVLNSCYHCH